MKLNLKNLRISLHKEFCVWILTKNRLAFVSKSAPVSQAEALDE